MEISKINIKKIEPNKGHVGFCSLVVDDWLYLNNIAIFTRLNEPERIRLVFPEKKIGIIKISLFHPLDAKMYQKLEELVLEEYKQL